MSGPLFEQYKSALRRGHVAALAGRLEDALEAYREAARLVPDRALPLVSIGTALHRLDRWDEASRAFDAAIRLAPDDEAALRARGTALEERGRRSMAASDFEHLALVLDAAGKASEAIEAARRADELEGSSARTALLARLIDPEGRAAQKAGPSQAAAATPAGRSAVPPSPAGGDGSSSAPDRAPAGQSGGSDAEPADDADWPLIDLPTPPPPPIVGPAPDPETLLTNAVVLLDAGDLSAARDLMLSAVHIHRGSGRLDAALDICLQLLAIAPGDTQVHLAIANLQLDHGWQPVASEKVDLLRQLTGLTGDEQGIADVQFLSTERLRETPARSGGARAGAPR